MNKKSIKYALYVTICSLAMVVLTGLGLRGVKAESLTADLDGDGKKDVIEWDLSWDDVWGDVLSELTINGKDVYKETKSDVIISEFYDYYVYVADTCTADKYKELVISTDRSEVMHIIRYRKGKIYKPITISGSSIVEQKKKNVIKVVDWIYVKGLGQFYTEIEYKIKSDKATIKTKTFKAANGKTGTLKSTTQMTIYEDTSLTKKVGTLKAGQKFKAYKYKKDKNGEFTLIYIMNKDGVKGWISTKDIPDYEYIIDNPPMWG